MKGNSRGCGKRSRRRFYDRDFWPKRNKHQNKNLYSQRSKKSSSRSAIHVVRIENSKSEIEFEDESAEYNKELEKIEFEKLPHEIWVRIFLFLRLVDCTNKISLVSKTCHNLIHSPYFFRCQAEIYNMDFEIYKNLFRKNYPNDESFIFPKYESMFKKRFASNIQNYGHMAYFQNSSRKLFDIGETRIFIPNSMKINISENDSFSLNSPDTRRNLVFFKIQRKKYENNQKRRTNHRSEGDDIYVIDINQKKVFPIVPPWNYEFKTVVSLFVVGNILIVIEETPTVHEDDVRNCHILYILFDSKKGKKDEFKVKDLKKIIFQKNDIVCPIDCSGRGNSFIFRYVSNRNALRIIDEKNFKERDSFIFSYKYKEKFPDIKEMQAEDDIICCIFNDEIIVLRFFPEKVKLELLKSIKMMSIFDRYTQFLIRKDFILDGSIYILFKKGRNKKKKSSSKRINQQIISRSIKKNKNKKKEEEDKLMIVKVRLDKCEDDDDEGIETFEISDIHKGIFEGILINPYGKLLTICSFEIFSDDDEQQQQQQQEQRCVGGKEKVYWKTYDMRKNFKCISQCSIITGSEKYYLKNYFERRYGGSELLVLGECQNDGYNSLKIRKFDLLGNNNDYCNRKKKDDDDDDVKMMMEDTKKEQLEIVDAELTNICVTSRGIIIVKNEGL